MTENIWRMFYQDIREKKKTSSGAFHKTGKGVKHTMRGIKTPYDFMTNKERKQLSGKVEEWNMYDTILTKAEFDLQPQEEQKKLLSRWRELYPNATIQKEMGIANNTLAHYVRDLGIKPKPRGGSIPRKKKENEQVTLATAFQEVKKEQQPVVSNGMTFSFKGTYKAEQITKMLDKLSLLLSDEESDFEVDITVREK